MAPHCQFVELNGGELCVGLDLEWNSTFDNPLVQFSFRKKLYDSPKNRSPATPNSFDDIPATYVS
jgi:hypothetical protein